MVIRRLLEILRGWGLKSYNLNLTWNFQRDGGGGVFKPKTICLRDHGYFLEQHNLTWDQVHIRQTDVTTEVMLATTSKSVPQWLKAFQQNTRSSFPVNLRDAPLSCTITLFINKFIFSDEPSFKLAQTTSQ